MNIIPEPFSNSTNFDRSCWFDNKNALRYIGNHLQTAQNDIRIASGFFTIRGWNLIRRHTKNKNTYILVGLDDPGEERARKALIAEIMRDLRTGLDRERRQAVYDLVAKVRSDQFQMVDARATDHHAKLYIVDDQIAIIASSNLTGRGLSGQIEAGNVVTDKKEVIALVQEFEEYFAKANDITQELLEVLSKWLKFVMPWDIYLKTMLAFENIKPVKTRYQKNPVSYQVYMIAKTLRDIKSFSGSMLVASTGLGKTVVAIHVALHLHDEDIIDNIMIIGPKSVCSNWKREMREAGLPCEYFVRQAFDKESAKEDGSLEDFEEIKKFSHQQRWLLIIDESHEFRNRYKKDLFNTKELSEERRAFKRLREFCQQGNLKVLLLTGSPYATEIDNINNQLFLLPHTGENHALLPDYTDNARAWNVNDVDEFIHLPVANRLTTPYVAKYYGQEEEQNIYISFGKDRLYIPRVTLHTITFPLLFETEMTKVIIDGYFKVKSRKFVLRDLVNRLVKIAWSSSAFALQAVLESVIDTPGGDNSYQVKFVHSREERQRALIPIINKLKKIDCQKDIKFNILLTLIQEAKNKNQKIIIFCERRATVVFLQKNLQNILPLLSVTATIESNEDSSKFVMKETKEIEKLIKQFAPIANKSQEGIEIHQKYDVFISTDAHGVGINMQDASIVINYDIDWTPINLIQRAGRVLRFWHSPRMIEIYTFVPTLTSQTNLKYDLLEIKKRWVNLMIRHQESTKLMDWPTLTSDNTEEINLTEVASEPTIKSGELNLDALADCDISPDYQHTAKLQLNRSYTQTIPDDIVSAKTYSESTPSVYVLLLYNQIYYGVFYDPINQQLSEPTIVKILDKIACNKETEIANVDYDEVEKLSHNCIEIWCAKHNAKSEDVERICVLYLKPEEQGDSLVDLFA